MRAEPCQCGGLIVARADDDTGFAAVYHHQRSARHRAWSRDANSRPDRRVLAVDFIAAFRRSHAYGPSVREVAAAIDVKSTAAAAYVLNRLRADGAVEWDERVARSLRLVEDAA